MIRKGRKTNKSEKKTELQRGKIKGGTKTNLKEDRGKNKSEKKTEEQKETGKGKGGTKNQQEKEKEERNNGGRKKKERGQFSSQHLSSPVQNAPEMHHWGLSQMNI